MLKNLLVILLLAMLVNSQASTGNQYTVLSIYDGDTATLRNNSNSQTFRLRVVCVDAPEIGQDPWGKISRDRLVQLVPLNSKVNLNIIELDQYGRVLAELITLKGDNVGKEMLAKGLLVRYPYQRNCQSYDSLESSAKANKLGVWSDRTFVLPYEWRRTTVSPAIGK